MSRWIVGTIFITLCLLICAGCASKGPTGTWRTNREAQHRFEAGEIFKDHSYYYTGSKVQPDAVIAISNAFTLQSNLWVPIDISKSILDKWLFMFKTEISYTCLYRGGYITTPDDRIAGMWYSMNELNTIRFPEPGIIEVYQPFSIPGSGCDRERFWDDL